MPTFTDIGIDIDPNIQYIQNNASQVEPLDGPVSVDSLMDRFPDTVYTQGRDTHLYKFISAMCGDAGAGLLKKQAYYARLRNEGELLTFSDLDTFYVQTLRFPRLSNEIYSGELNPDIEALTKEQWDEIHMKDEKFRHRIQNFFSGARLGNSPDGMALIAESGSGVPVDIIENYQAIFDSQSDDPMGLTVEGLSASPNEFVIIPRLVDENDNVDTDVGYEATFGKFYDPIGQHVTYDLSATPYMKPEIERNMIDVLDRLRPVGALMTVKNRNVIYKPISLAHVDGSSERAFVSRFVTGNEAVDWLPVDNFGHFIQGGIETEAPFFGLSGRELPAIFHTIENVHAYTEQALDDALYNTSDFYLVNSGVSPYMRYRSEHVGNFHRVIASIYTYLKTVTSEDNFYAENAIAGQNTQLIFEGRSK